MTALDERRVRALAFGRGVDGLQLEKAAAALKRMRRLGLEKRDLIDIIGQGSRGPPDLDHDIETQALLDAALLLESPDLDRAHIISQRDPITRGVFRRGRGRTILGMDKGKGEF